MKLAIMQPYLFPYIGYFQLINAVDNFVLYDNIQFTKKGWINRNRILVNGTDAYITLPLKKDSDFLDICERSITDDVEERNKIIRKITGSYSTAPHFKTVLPVIKEIMEYKDNNLFNFVYNSINRLCEYLDINTPFTISSEINIDHTLRGQEKVIAICKEMGATEYINPPGGKLLYSEEIFRQNNIQLRFLAPDNIEYMQPDHTFVPWLSIIDVLMFNPKEKIKDQFLNSFTLT